MSTMSAHDAVVASLANVAPEADVSSLRLEADLRDELDLDSMDFLSFMAGIDELTGIEIPERDYPQLLTLERCVDYLGRRMATG